MGPQTRSLLTFLPANRCRYTLAGADNLFLLVELSPLTFPSSADQARIMKLDAIIVLGLVFGQRRPSFCRAVYGPQGPSATQCPVCLMELAGLLMSDSVAAGTICIQTESSCVVSLSE